MQTKEYTKQWYQQHRDKCLADRAAWRAKNKDYFREYAKKNRRKVYRLARSGAYRRKYGITIAQYERLLRKQKYVCAICHKPKKKFRLAVDHDHATGKIRGLLCVPCNLYVVGRLDDLKLRKRIFKYLGL
jgi:hypothetical protein